MLRSGPVGRQNDEPADFGGTRHGAAHLQDRVGMPDFQGAAFVRNGRPGQPPMRSDRVAVPDNDEGAAGYLAPLILQHKQALGPNLGDPPQEGSAAQGERFSDVGPVGRQEGPKGSGSKGSAPWPPQRGLPPLGAKGVSSFGEEHLSGAPAAASGRPPRRWWSTRPGPGTGPSPPPEPA